MKQPKKLNHPRKAFITVQNIDYNKCFKWFLVRHLNPADHQLPRIRKAGKDIKFPVKIRDTHKIEKKNSISISVFDYENKEKHPVYVSKKCCEEKHVDLLLIGKERKGHYVPIKHSNIFMYDRKYRRNIKTLH